MSWPPFGKDQKQDLYDYEEEPGYELEHEPEHGSGTGESTPTVVLEDMLPRDQQPKSAFYDYASEKSLSHADAKLFYQRHQLEQLAPVENPILSKHGWISTGTDGDTENLRRSGSMGSKRFRSALTSGFPSLDKIVDASNIQSPDVNRFDRYQRDDILSGESLSARSPSLRAQRSQEPGSPSPTGRSIPVPRPPVNPSQGSGVFAANDESVASELNSIYTNIQKIIDMRHKYVRLSLQGDGDNPRDDACWTIYPPHPGPVWDEEQDRPYETEPTIPSLIGSRILSSDQDPQNGHYQQHASSSSTERTQEIPRSQCKLKRKPGQDIGEDFRISDLLPLPEEAEMSFKLDENGVYQVYETSKSAELETPILAIPTIRDFYMDLDSVLTISSGDFFILLLMKRSRCFWFMQDE